MATFGRSLFETDFLGKKIYDKLFGLYSKKPPGTGGGGGSGGSIGGSTPDYLPGIVVISSVEKVIPHTSRISP